MNPHIVAITECNPKNDQFNINENTITIDSYDLY